MSGMHNTARKYLAFSGESGLRAALFVYNRKQVRKPLKKTTKTLHRV